MSDSEEPVRIVLTPEQREAIHRASGQHVEVIEISPEDAVQGRGKLKFKWRLSEATGIPRQAWMLDDDIPPPPAQVAE
ncbi:MAG TPA: hypothetical protein VE967_10310 [Gemmatimonadaceae bacterium]|nr:hypothetical protein [Gemmatimonadaceae bacterium]